MPFPSLSQQLLNCFQKNLRLVHIVLLYCNNEKWVSLGSDCQIPIVLKQLNVRDAAYPFDNNLTLGPVLPWFQQDFRDFCRITHTKSLYPNNKYRVCFLHDESPLRPNLPQWRRRCNRLLASLFNGDSQCVHHFVRTTHKRWHHEMMPCMHPQAEIDDMIQLMKFFKQHRQNPSVRGTLFVTCSECFPDQSSEHFKSLSLNIHVLPRLTNVATNEEMNTVITEALIATIRESATRV